MLSITTRAAAVVVALILPAVASAQAASGSRAGLADDGGSAPAAHRLTGFVLGVRTVGAQGVSITGPDIDGEFRTNAGTGAGVMLGYGFSRYLSGYVALDVARQRPAAATTTYDATFGLAYLEGGLRVVIPSGMTSTFPYLSASYGRRGIGAHVLNTEQDEDYDMTMFGNVVGLGGGIERFITPTLALDVGAAATLGRFDHYRSDRTKAPLDVNASRTLRVQVGMNWRPGGRRSP